MKSKLGFLAIAAMTFFTGCNDSDSPTGTSTGGGVDAILNKNWQITAFTIDPGINFGGTIITDWFAQMEDCEKDDIMRFTSDGKTSSDEGSLKCESDAPQTVVGTWAANPTGTIVTITDADGSESWNIESVTATTLKVNYSSDMLGDGINRKATITSVAK